MLLRTNTSEIVEADKETVPNERYLTPPSYNKQMANESQVPV